MEVRPNDQLSFTVPNEQIIEWRRQMHAHPELSFKEVNTSQWVEDLLQGMGIETSRPTPTSVLGVLKGTGQGPAKNIGLRADMDALPVQEETGEEFSSTVDGVMHACGHDTHTAMQLGAAKVLSENTDLFGGTVTFVFQHAEELNPGGAQEMVRAGAMEGLDGIFALHVMNAPVGTVQVRPGPATSLAGGGWITIKGHGSHGSMPQNSIDPVLVAAQVVVGLNTIVSRSVDPSHFMVINPGMIQAGQAPNVIPDSATIGVSVRTRTAEDTDLAFRRIEELTNGICAAYGASVEYEWVDAYDIVYNDAALAAQALESAKKVAGDDNAWEGEISSGSEDFSAFANEVPGCFIILGGGDAEQGFPFQNHHPKFNVREDCLAIGTALEVQLILDLLGPDTAE